MRRDEFLKELQDGIDHGMWIATQIDEKDGRGNDAMKEWMARRIVEMLDTMTLLDILEVSELRELNKTGKSYLYGDLYRWYPEELEKAEQKILKRKGGQAPEDSLTVATDERTTNSSLFILSQEV